MIAGPGWTIDMGWSGSCDRVGTHGHDRSRVVALREMLRTFLAKRGASCADAEDVAQDVVVRLLQSPRHMTEFQPTALYVYAQRTALHRYIKSQRNAMRRALREERWCALELTRPPDPHLELERRRVFSTGIARLAALPPKLGEPLVLCDIEGMTCERAAETLGVKLGTLKTRLRKARALCTAGPSL